MSSGAHSAATLACELSIENERQINSLLLRYCTAIDTRDWRLLRSCLTDDFRADYGSFGVWNDADAFTVAMQHLHSTIGPTLHRLSNLVVHPVTTGEVSVRSYVDAILMSAHAGDPHHQGIGVYDDELVTTDEGWKITRRRFTAVRIL
jgi:hypothetical protein